MDFKTYPDSLRMIAQKVQENMNFELKIKFEKLDFKINVNSTKIVRTIELHVGTDLWPAITLARIKIFW